jgi:hypothetical protein
LKQGRMTATRGAFMAKIPGFELAPRLDVRDPSLLRQRRS